MNRPKVFLTGGDDVGWAVDEDLRLTREAVEGVVDPADLSSCDVVHAMWWEGLMMLSPEDLIGKHVVCNVPGEPSRYFTVPGHRRALPLVGRWVTRTSQGFDQMRGFGIDSVQIPYLIDVETFKPLGRDSETVAELRAAWNLPTDVYLIGSFQRDTEGSDLRSPKLMKGPDVLLEILLGLQRRRVRFHLILAGPRRHWLVRQCAVRGIPFTYVGKLMDGDDLKINSLPRSTLNVLYNMLDLYVVASRTEGGPHAILEAAASRCKVVSSRVGMAPDVLEPQCIFRSAPEAASIIERDAGERFLDETRDLHHDRVQLHHRPATAAHLFQRMYAELDSIPRFRGVQSASIEGPASVERKGETGITPPERSKKNTLTVGLWHTFYAPPYGGGNQFMMALKKGLLRQGVEVRENELSEDIDAYVLNSIHFDVDRFMEFSSRHRINVIHRIDGPIHLIRGYDREKDELCFDLNTRFASATVIQSAWTYQRIVEMGYQPVNAVIIRNAVDSEIFHPRGRIAFDPRRKIRLISTSWSNNPRKGGPVYKWIEEHLDWDRFEYTFVGNVSENFTSARHIPPVSSEELAGLLRDHDIYITASRNDPCSNALIEAMACGLPALYLDDGGHPELVGQGGLPFGEEAEILPRLEQIVANYATFQRLISVSTLDDVAAKYLALVREVVQ